MIPASVMQAAVPKKKNNWWKVSIAFFVIFLIMMGISSSNDTYEGETYFGFDDNGDGRFQEWYVCENGESIEVEYVDDGNDDCGDWSDEREYESPIISVLGSLSCCFSFIFGGVAISTSFGSKEKIVIVQQQPQYIPVVQQVVQPVQRAAPVQQPQQPPVGIPASVTTNQLRKQAQNLEKARDFDAAAKLYQKAGMYEDAGRVRQAHLEKEEQSMVQIGQVGNTVLNDSVMINDGTPAGPKTCWACQNTIEDTWAVCPNCEVSL